MLPLQVYDNPNSLCNGRMCKTGRTNWGRPFLAYRCHGVESRFHIFIWQNTFIKNSNGFLLHVFQQKFHSIKTYSPWKHIKSNKHSMFQDSKPPSCLLRIPMKQLWVDSVQQKRVVVSDAGGLSDSYFLQGGGWYHKKMVFVIEDGGFKDVFLCPENLGHDPSWLLFITWVRLTTNYIGYLWSLIIWVCLLVFSFLNFINFLASIIAKETILKGRPTACHVNLGSLPVLQSKLGYNPQQNPTAPPTPKKQIWWHHPSNF